ncbi:unnamed protein product [Sphenostylis stenocarpa]|uniref:Uncharacterized protein n=1 Tax=Sphenostylis stenocarpa TaxID=92480 RepID=A0AA86RXR3_9FABA|nr:unnamed protein product [Sphenostylis stenocarpa]
MHQVTHVNSRPHSIYGFPNSSPTLSFYTPQCSKVIDQAKALKLRITFPCYPFLPKNQDNEHPPFPSIPTLVFRHFRNGFQRWKHCPPASFLNFAFLGQLMSHQSSRYRELSSRNLMLRPLVITQH